MSGPYIRITEQRIPAIASSVVKAADSVTGRLGGNPDISRQKIRQRTRPAADGDLIVESEPVLFVP